MSNDRFKFRAWHKTYGSYLMDTDFCIEDGSLFDLDSAGDRNYFVDPIIMQCTGLKDVNDKLMFDKDIFETPRGQFLIEWGNDSWRALGMEENSSLYSVGYRYKIIGNIYENPELLK